MRRQLLALFLILVVCCCSTATYAQQSKTPAEKAHTENAELRAKAFALLESLAGELGTLQSAENRARIGSNIAGSLWPHNEQRARELFALVQQDISANLQIVERPTVETNHTLVVFMNLRGDTIQRISRHDPELAHSFFKATEMDRERLPFAVRKKEQDLELFLAKRVATTNPDIAVELSLKSTKYEFSDELPSIVRQLNRKHKEQAATLYKALVRKLRNSDLSSDTNARDFAVRLVNVITPPAVDESSFRELVGMFIKLATTSQCPQRVTGNDYDIQRICTVVGAMLHHISKVDPLRANQLKHWAPESFYGGPPPGSSELLFVAEDGTVEEILAFGSRYPALKTQALWLAITKARNEGDYERARKLIAEYENFTNRPSGMLNQIEGQQGKLRLDEEKLAAERKRIAEAPQVMDRIRATIALAYGIGAADRANALKLLEEAREMVEALNPGKEQTLLQILLATIYCTQGSDRGLRIMEAIVPRLNEVIEGAVKLDGYDTRYLREGEWNMSAEGPLGNLLTQVANNAGYFAWYDFDRAVELAGQFQRPEIRMMAQLKLAQGILAGPPLSGSVNIWQR